MTKEEFLGVVANTVFTYYPASEEDKKRRSWELRCGYWARRHEDMKNVTLEDVIRQEWTTGGTRGGSCWDDGEVDRHYSYSGDPEPELKDLDTLLTTLCPGITYIQYKNLVNGLIKCTGYSVDEYYGNYSNYGVKMVVLGELYNKLTAMGFV